MNRFGKILSIAIGLAAATACTNAFETQVDIDPKTDGGGAPKCVPGEVKMCMTPGGATGTMVCDKNGDGYGPCMPPTTTTTTTGSGGTGGTTTTTTTTTGSGGSGGAGATGGAGGSGGAGASGGTGGTGGCPCPTGGAGGTGGSTGGSGGSTGGTGGTPPPPPKPDAGPPPPPVDAGPETCMKEVFLHYTMPPCKWSDCSDDKDECYAQPNRVVFQGSFNDSTPWADLCTSRVKQDAGINAIGLTEGGAARTGWTYSCTVIAPYPCKGEGKIRWNVRLEQGDRQIDTFPASLAVQYGCYRLWGKDADAAKCGDPKYCDPNTQSCPCDREFGSSKVNGVLMTAPNGHDKDNTFDGCNNYVGY